MKKDKKLPSNRTEKKKVGRLRRWFRRLAFLVGFLVILTALLNVILLAALPSILESEAEKYGLSCSYDRLSFSIFTTDLELWQLEVAPLHGEGRFVDLEYCRADLVVHELLFGNLDVLRIEVDGMDCWIERDADGTFPLLSRFQSDASQEEEPSVAETPEDASESGEDVAESDEDTPPGRLDLSLFFKLHALRLQHVYANITDRTQDPPLKTKFEANVRVSHVGTEKRPLRFEVALSSLPVLESLRFEGHCRITPDEIATTLDLDMRGLHPKTLAHYLTPLGFTPYADSIAFQTHAEVTARVNEERPDTVSLHAETSGIRLLVDDAEAVALDRFTLDAPHINAACADLSDVEIEGVRANASRDADRLLCVAGFRLHTPAQQEENDSAEEPEPVEESTKPFSLNPPKVVILDVEASFVDRAVTPAAKLCAVLERMTVDPVSEGEIDPVTLAGLRLDLDGLITLPGIAKRVRLTGRADPFSAKKRIDLQCRTTGIAPDALSPYLASAGIEPLLENGSFSFDVSAVADPSGEDRLAAELELKNVLLSDQGPLLGFDALSVKGAVVDSAANAIHVEEVALSGTHGGVRLDDRDRLLVCGLTLPFGGSPEAEGMKKPEDAAGSASDNGRWKSMNGPSGEPNRRSGQEARPPVSPVDSSRESATKDAESGAAPSLCIEKLIWSDNRFVFSDARRSPAQEITISDTGFEATHLVFDPRAEAILPEPAALRAWFRAPGLVDSLVMKGRLSSEKRKVALSMKVRGKGITAGSASAYLEAAGCRPALEDGRLRLNLDSSVEVKDNGIEASMNLTDLSFSDKGTEWLGLDALRVVSFKTGPDCPRIEKIEIARPRALVRRLESGAPAAGGFVFEPMAPETISKSRETAEGVPPDSASALVASQAIEAGSTSRPKDASTGSEPKQGILFMLNELDLKGAEVFWNDRAVQPVVDTSLQLDLDLSDFEFGSGADPSAVRIELRIPGALDAFTLDGTAKIDPDDMSTRLALNAKGMRPGPFTSYLGGPIEPTLEEGRLKAEIQANLSRHKEGGQKAGVSVLGLEFGEGDQGHPYLKWGGFQAKLGRVDMENGIVAVENLGLSDCEAYLKRNARGDLSLMGITLPAPSPDGDGESAGTIDAASGKAVAGNAATGNAATGNAATGNSATGNSATGKEEAGKAATGMEETGKAPTGKEATAKNATKEPASGKDAARDVALSGHPLRKWGEHPPLVTLDDLLLEFKLITEIENPETHALETVETSLNLHDEAPIRLLGKEPEANPPVRLKLRSRVEPGLGSFGIALEAQPFAPDPLLIVDLSASGIAAQPIIDRVPGLAEKVDGRGLEDGTFKGHIETRMIAKRRSPLDFNLSNGFGLEFELKDVEFRNKPDGPVMAGLDDLFLDATKIRPDTGDIHVASLDIAKPALHVMKDEDGLHLLGLVLKERIPSEESSDQQGAGEEGKTTDEKGKTDETGTREETVKSAGDGAAKGTLAAGAGAEIDPTPASASVETPRGEPVAPSIGTLDSKTPPVEIKVDQFFLTDIDFSMEDRSVNPPMIVPLNQLDVEVRDFTSLALSEPRPFRFSVNVGAGDVPLPERKAKGGILSALGGAVTDLAGLGAEKGMQNRPLFDEITAGGRIVLKPAMRGWINARVSALELGDFKGVVEKSGVNLNDGLLDTDVALRFRNDGSLLTKAKFDLTCLDVSEPPDGLISKYLKLPAPLDVVVFLLRDEDESISIPLDFEVGADGMSAAGIAGVAATTLGSLITDAVAGSPFRIVGGTLGDLVPLGKEEEQADEQGPFIALAFEPGDSRVNPGMARQLETLAERLEDDEELSVLLRHELSARDLKLADRNANPSQEECLELSQRFRRDRKRIAEERDRLAAQAVAALSAGLEREGRLALDRIRALDREAGRIEKSLDETLTLLQPGAERRAPRRTRRTCLDLGLARLENVKKFLSESGAADVSERVRISRPRMMEKPVLEKGEVQVFLKGRKK